MTQTITIKQLNHRTYVEIMVIYNDSSDFTEKMQNYQEYIGALEEERRKIQVFERELPLCLDLVSQTIERCRRQTSSEGPVLEEFLPIKQVSSTNEDDKDDYPKQNLCHKSEVICSKDKTSPYSLKSDWLTSAQLAIQVRDPPKEEDFLSKKLVDVERNKNAGGGFLSLQKKASVSSSADTDGGDGSGTKGEDKGQSHKKERRCWSSDLHRLFLHVLQQLGGAHVATPKQIRELMKVDGLTNDEIKSHLQKYRLHTRRINPSINDTHTPQLVVVGRLWMPPLEYGSQLTDNANDTKSVYAPTA